MKIYPYFLSLLFLFLMGNSICHSKKLVVSDITYLPSDRTATELPVLDVNEEMCALIKLPFPKVDETVISGDQILKKEYHGNEWYIYMPPETFKFFIKHPGFDDLEIDLSKKFPRGVEAGKTYKIIIPYDSSEITPIITSSNPDAPNKSTNSFTAATSHNAPTTNYSTRHNDMESLIYKNCFYIQAGYNVVGLSGVCIGIGGYISNLNIEANYLMGLSKSEDIYWNYSSGDGIPIIATYSPMGFNLKLGYGIILGSRFRLSPHVGFKYAVLQEKADKKVANNANAIALPIGVKIDFAIIKHFGISLEPSYKISINQSEGYKILSNISSKIKGYSDGFGLNISLYCNF